MMDLKKLLHDSDSADAELNRKIDALEKNIDDVKTNYNKNKTSVVVHQLSGFSNESNFKITTKNKSANTRRSYIEFISCNQGGKPPVKIEFSVIVPDGQVKDIIKVDNPNGSTYDVDVFIRYNASEKSSNISIYFKSVSNLWGDTYLYIPGNLDAEIEVENSSSIRSDASAVKATQSKVSYS